MTAAGLALYAATLAPTVLWGDDAELQRIVQTGEARVIGQSSSASHLLWLWLARRFVPAAAWLPLDAAGRTTLVSALAGALALPVVFLAAGEVARPIARRPYWAGLAAALALALSHTFWLLAVRPDVYTLEVALLAAATWCVCRWRRSDHPPAYLIAAGAAVALALSNHAMILASVPGLALLALAVPSRAHRRLAFTAAAGGMVAAVAAAAAMAAGLPAADLLRAVGRYRPLAPTLREAAAFPAYLAYQFPLSLPLAAWGALRLRRRDPGALLGLLAMYAGSVALVLFPAQRVRDQFLFYLPSYLPVALLAGAGAAAAVEQFGAAGARRSSASAAVAAVPAWPAPVALSAVLALLAAPIAVYPVAAVAAGAAAARLAPARALPGRDPIAFYLLPPKRGYAGARTYGERALAELAPNAAVVADWLPYQTLQYLQRVEGRRPDVLLAQINAGGGAQLRFLLEQQTDRPLYLAEASGYPYYELPEIESCFTVTARGAVYRLTPRPARPAACA